MNKRSIVAIAAFGWTAAFLLIGRGQWLSSLEHEAQVGRADLSTPIDLAKPGHFEWRVDREHWSYREGEAMLSLVLDRSDGPQERNTLPLRIKVAAWGRDNTGLRNDRLVHNWYYTTDEPFGKDARLWSTFGERTVEHGLAGVMIYPFEETIISLNIEKGDTTLTSAHPRLKLVGNHDYAVFDHLRTLELLRDAGLLISLAALGLLLYLSLKPEAHRAGT